MTEPKSASASQAALYLDMSREQLRRLVGQRVITRRSEGRFVLDQIRIEYVRHLKDRAAARSSEKLESDSRAARAKAELTELKVRRQRGELMNLPGALAYMGELVAGLFGALDGVPTEFCGRDLAGRRRLQAIIERHRNNFADQMEAKIKQLKAEAAA